VPSHLTIRLNRLIERKYKRTTNERTMVTEQNPHLVSQDNSWKFNFILALHAPTCNFEVTRITNIWMQQQFQVF